MAHDRHSRRTFLQGKAAVREIAGGARDSEQQPAPRQGVMSSDIAARSPLTADHATPLASIRRRAMACDWEVQLAANRDDNSMEYVFHALDLVESLEVQMTIYHADSEVIRINHRAADGPMAIERRLFAVFQLAAQVHRDTEGAYDITSGPLSDVWGFSRRQGRIPGHGEIDTAMERVGMQHVVLDDAGSTIAFDQPGINLNLNSIGKGYALDRMAELLDEGVVCDYLVHGGRSSVLARGDHPDRPGRGWSIGLRHPLRPAERLAEFFLLDQSLSTSGSGTQFFQRRGRRYGHILDPRTGWPAEGMYSATVIAPTAAEADALSTAFYVMGPEKTAAFCGKHPDVAALLVSPTERSGDIQLYAYNLTANQWQQLDQ